MKEIPIMNGYEYSGEPLGKLTVDGELQRLLENGHIFEFAPSLRRKADGTVELVSVSVLPARPAAFSEQTYDVTQEQVASAIIEVNKGDEVPKEKDA